MVFQETSFLLLLQLQINLPTNSFIWNFNGKPKSNKNVRNSGDFGNKCSTIHNTAKITKTIKNQIKEIFGFDYDFLNNFWINYMFFFLNLVWKWISTIIATKSTKNLINLVLKEFYKTQELKGYLR